VKLLGPDVDVSQCGIYVCVSDESVIGGLSLLLMAGQHDATFATSPVLTGADSMKSSNLLMNAVSLESRDLQPCQVNSVLTVLHCVSKKTVPLKQLGITSSK